ncbi:MAG: SpoIIE family protein phosphatase, partial [Bacteroidales bacterium]
MLFAQTEDRFYIEIAHSQQYKKGEIVGGDAFISADNKEEERFIAVLSDGLGSGIRANVLSSLMASMAVSYRLQHRPLENSMISIMDTLPLDSVKNIGYATCSVAEIDYNGEAHLMEFDNPDFIIFRGNKCIETRKKSIRLDTKQGERILLESKIMLFKGDRIIMISDGVTQSGLGSSTLPMGWERSLVIDFVQDYLEKHPDVSARDLSKVIMQKAIHNDLFEAKDDITCGVIYLRAPRRLLICTGPPFDPTNDPKMAQIFDLYSGKKIVCGGTTAQILAREL